MGTGEVLQNPSRTHKAGGGGVFRIFYEVGPTWAPPFVCILEGFCETSSLHVALFKNQSYLQSISGLSLLLYLRFRNLSLLFMFNVREHI